MTKSELKILLINCNPEDVKRFQNALSIWQNTTINLEIAETPSQGLEYLQKGVTDLVLLDMSKSAQGLSILRVLCAQSIAAPVIAIVETDDEETGVAVITEGAQDLCFKNNINKETLRHSIRYVLDRQRLAAELKLANDKILEQQDSIKEQDRLKSLLEQ